MAEIRKHNPSVSNPIDAALLAALGEPVRPVVPGAPKPAAAAQPARTDDVTRVDVTHVTAGDGTWVAFPTHTSWSKPAHPVEPPEQADR